MGQRNVLSCTLVLCLICSFCVSCTDKEEVTATDIDAENGEWYVRMRVRIYETIACVDPVIPVHAEVKVLFYDLTNPYISGISYSSRALTDVTVSIGGVIQPDFTEDSTFIFQLDSFTPDTITAVIAELGDSLVVDGEIFVRSPMQILGLPDTATLDTDQQIDLSIGSPLNGAICVYIYSNSDFAQCLASRSITSSRHLHWYVPELAQDSIQFVFNTSMWPEWTGNFEDGTSWDVQYCYHPTGERVYRIN